MNQSAYGSSGSDNRYGGPAPGMGMMAGAGANGIGGQDTGVFTGQAAGYAMANQMNYNSTGYGQQVSRCSPVVLIVPPVFGVQGHLGKVVMFLRWGWVYVACLCCSSENCRETANLSLFANPSKWWRRGGRKCLLLAPNFEIRGIFGLV